MKRLSCVSLVNGVKIVDYKLPVTPKTPYIIDDSNFCPMSEAIKSLAKSPQITSDEIYAYYDFPNGRDTGKKIPFERSADFHDIVELSNSIVEDSKNIAEDIEKTSKKAERIKKFQSSSLNPSNDSALSTPSGKTE